VTVKAPPYSTVLTARVKSAARRLGSDRADWFARTERIPWNARNYPDHYRTYVAAHVGGTNAAVDDLAEELRRHFADDPELAAIETRHDGDKDHRGDEYRALVFLYWKSWADDRRQ
jgi:hypothetical protein